MLLLSLPESFSSLCWQTPNYPIGSKILWIFYNLLCWRIDVFKLWSWKRCLRVPWTARRSNQSILKGINPEYSLKGLMLKLQYFGHLMQRADPLEKTLMLGKIEGRWRTGWQKIGWLSNVTDSMNLSKLWEIVEDKEAWRATVHGVAKSRIQLGDWTTTEDWVTSFLPPTVRMVMKSESESHSVMSDSLQPHGL